MHYHMRDLKLLFPNHGKISNFVYCVFCQVYIFLKFPSEPPSEKRVFFVFPVFIFPFMAHASLREREFDDLVI